MPGDARPHLTLLFPPTPALASGLLPEVQARGWTVAALMPGIPELLQADKDEADALLVYIGQCKLLRWYSTLSQVVVNLSAGCGTPAVPSVWPDNHRVGAAAAEHLLDLGLEHFAFAGNAAEHYCEQRLAGLRDGLADTGFAAPAVFDHLTAAWEGPEAWEKTLGELESWVHSLPTPVGVFAADDHRAAVIQRACACVGRRVPQDVAIIGANNAEVVCEFQRPPLTSVDLPHADIGRAAGELVADLLAGEPPPTEPRVIPGARVIARGSTDTVAVADPAFAEAVRFIRREAAVRPLSIGEVVESAPLSRRTLDRRFSETFDRTAAEEIARIRERRARSLLRETGWPVKRIAHEMGFSTSQELGRFLRTRTGRSPTELRGEDP